MICNSANRIHQLSGQDFEILCQWQTLRMIIDQKCRGMVKALIPIIHIPQIAVTLTGPLGSDHPRCRVHSDRITPIEDEAKKEGHFGNNRRASWGLTTYDGYEPRITGVLGWSWKNEVGNVSFLHKLWDTRHMFQGLHLRMLLQW